LPLILLVIIASLLATLVSTVIFTGTTTSRVPATAEDWFVVFDVDRVKMGLTLAFFPVLAFDITKGPTGVVTSRPDAVARLLSSRLTWTISEDACEHSCVFGYWIRDGATMDDSGSAKGGVNPPSFSEIVTRFVDAGFSVAASTSVPNSYRHTLQV
jgi:hypothetical protein